MDYIDALGGVVYLTLIGALQYIKMFMTEKELRFWTPVLRQLILVLVGLRMYVGVNGNVTFIRGSTYVGHRAVKRRTGKTILAVQFLVTALAVIVTLITR